MESNPDLTNAGDASVHVRQPRGHVAAEAERRRYIDLFDLAPIAYLSMDADQIIGEANLAAANLLGCSRERLRGANFSSFLAEHSRIALTELLRKLFASGSSQSCAIELPCEHLPPTAVLLSAAPGSGNGECLVALTDIGVNRPPADAAASDSEGRLESIARMTSDFYWQTDTEHRLVVSEIFHKGSGVPTTQRAVVMGKRRWEVPSLTPDAAGWAAHRATLDAHLPFRNFEISRYGIDGIERHMTVSGEPMFDASGAFLGFRGLGRMITERKLAERRLRESEERYRSLFAKAGDGILILSRDGEIIAANEAFARMHGYSEQEMMHTSLRDMVTAQTFSLAPERWNRVLAGELLTVEVEHVHKNGHIFPVEISASQISSGNNAHMQLFYRDITERKRAEAALLAANNAAQSANRAKSRFLAAASHDLRQPVQAINLFLDALAQTALSAEQKEILEYLGMSVSGLRDLLNALLDISQLDAGVVKAETTSISGENLLRELEPEFARMASGKSLRLRFLAGCGLALATDPGLLLRALRNIIGNAINHTQRGGILVGIRARGAHALVQVWDTGVGIAPEHIGHVFEEYFQIGNPARDRAKGIGLGLAIAQRLVNLIGGKISCRSRPGRGTVFEIVLPLAPGPSKIDRRARARTDAAAGALELSRFEGLRIVVVEDDQLVSKGLEQALQALGAAVTLFSTAEDALASSAIGIADHYVCDFRLAGRMNGIELLDAIQGRSANPINAVLMTGETSSNQIELSASCNWKVLYKPVDLQALLSAL